MNTDKRKVVVLERRDPEREALERPGSREDDGLQIFWKAYSAKTVKWPLKYRKVMKDWQVAENSQGNHEGQNVSLEKYGARWKEWLNIP